MLVVRPSRVSVAFPFSSAWFGSHLREKTIRTANLLRYASIFRVKKLYVYLDSGGAGSHTEMEDLVRYLLLPPYLKIEEKIKPHLRYVGVAPPIKTPLHTVSGEPAQAASEPVRLATVIKTAPTETTLNAGFKQRTIAPPKRGVKVGDHVYVRVVGVRDDVVMVDFMEKGVLKDIYLQPEVVFTHPAKMGQLIGRSALKVELTRSGEPSIKLLQKDLGKDLVFFVGNQHLDPEQILDIDFDFKIRLLPEQGVETIRSEEALLIALAQSAWVSG